MRKLALALLVAVAAPSLAVAPLISGPAGAQARKPVIGHLMIGSPSTAQARHWFIEGLRELGYRDGESMVLVEGWAHGDMARWPRLAQELIERSPTVIVAPCGPPLHAIRALSRTVPVIASCSDESNFLGEVASLARTGGHTTGVLVLATESVGKRLELLREIVPAFSRLAVLHQPSNPIALHRRELDRLQPVLGLSYQWLPVERAEDLEAALDAAARGRAQAILVFPTTILIAQHARIAELARKHRLASAFELALHVEAGGLLSYGGIIEDVFRKSIPLYVDKILKGAKPGELPVIQPTRFELVVNLRTARELGLELPPSVLLRADRVIE